MKSKFVFCAAAIVLTSSFAMAQQVSVNYNHDANFSQYHTYAWGSNNANAIRNSILAQVAQQDIEAAMQQKGFQKVQENQSPDLVLTASGGEHESTSYNAWGMRGIGGGMGGSHRSSIACPPFPGPGLPTRAKGLNGRAIIAEERSPPRKKM